MKNVLVVLAHQDFGKSIANKTMIDQILMRVEGVKVRNIGELYPDYKIDVKAEQLALLEADLVVFQYPFYWYNMPSILKLWFDEVLSFNFAYGPEGDKLQGKGFQISITVGGPALSYTPLGYNHFRIEDFLKPLEQTAYLTKMIYLKPIYGHGMIYVPNVYNTKEDVVQRAMEQADRLVDAINSFLSDIEKV